MKEIIHLQKKAKLRLKELKELKKDPRYKKVIGRLIYEKLLFSDHIAPHRCFITLEDALWAAKLEPRVLELIPAIFLKKPRLFWMTTYVPPDLALVIRELKRGKATMSFRGVDPHQYEQWIDRIGRKGKRPSLLKTFRFNANDLLVLRKLQEKWAIKEISVIRKALSLALRD